MGHAMTSDEHKVLVDALLSEIGTAEKYNRLVAELQAEIKRLRLTDAEREAVSDAIYLCGATAGLANEQANANAWSKCAATLRGLLERTK